VSAAPAVEWNFFPYSTYTRRQLRVQYSIGPAYAEYHEETLFGKTEETRWQQEASATYEQREPWGTLETRLEEVEQHEPGPTEAERRRLLELGEDLHALWHHPAAPMALKKRLLRTVVEEIVADVHEHPPRTELRLHWKGGVHTCLVVPRNGRGQHGRATDRQVVDLVRELAKVCQDFEIARLLNRLGYRTGAGNGWTETRVRALRSHHEIPACGPKEERSWCTLGEAAQELGVSSTVVRRLLQEGVLEGAQVVTHAPWVIQRENLNAAAVQAAARAVREGRRAPRTPPGQTELPSFSTT